MNIKYEPVKLIQVKRFFFLKEKVKKVDLLKKKKLKHYIYGTE